MAEVNVRLRQFYNQKPINVVEYITLEIYHSAFTTPLRFVRNYTDQQLTLEGDAPRDAGQVVTFTALNFEAPDPDQDDSPDVMININLGRIGSEAKAQIKLIRDFGYMEPSQIIYRRYLSDDTSSPVTVYKLYAEQPVIQGRDVSVNATDDNPNRQDVSSLYTFDIYPGLEVI